MSKRVLALLASGLLLIGCAGNSASAPASSATASPQGIPSVAPTTEITPKPTVRPTPTPTAEPSLAALAGLVGEPSSDIIQEIIDLGFHVVPMEELEEGEAVGLASDTTRSVFLVIGDPVVAVVFNAADIAEESSMTAWSAVLMSHARIDVSFWILGVLNELENADEVTKTEVMDDGAIATIVLSTDNGVVSMRAMLSDGRPRP